MKNVLHLLFHVFILAYFRNPIQLFDFMLSSAEHNFDVVGYEGKLTQDIAYIFEIFHCQHFIIFSIAIEGVPDYTSIYLRSRSTYVCVEGSSLNISISISISIYCHLQFLIHLLSDWLRAFQTYYVLRFCNGNNCDQFSSELSR